MFTYFSFPPGVVRNATPLQTPERFWDANLVRWRGGTLTPVGGWSTVAVQALESPARHIKAFDVRKFPDEQKSQVFHNKIWALIGCDNHLYALRTAPTSELVNIAPSDFSTVQTYVADAGTFGSGDFGVLDFGVDTERAGNRLTVRNPAWSFAQLGDKLFSHHSVDERTLVWDGNSLEKARYLGAFDVSKIIIERRVQADQSIIIFTVPGPPPQTAVGDTITLVGYAGTDTVFTDLNGSYEVKEFSVDPLTAVATIECVYPPGGNTAVEMIASPTNYLGQFVSAPRSATCIAVTEEGHFVMFGLGTLRDEVAWSNREDPNNWDFSSRTTTAGSKKLQLHSPIIMAAQVREGHLLWTDDEVWLMRYVGLPAVYGFERLGEGCGLMAPHSYAMYSGRCIWMSKENFWMYSGGNLTPLRCDVTPYLFDKVNKEYIKKVAHGASNNLFPEVWFWVPSAGSQEPDKYAIYNYVEDWWSIGEMDRTAAVGATMFPHPLYAGVDNKLYFHENSWMAAGEEIGRKRYATTGGLQLDGGSFTSMIRQARVDGGFGYDKTNLTIYTKLASDAPEATGGPYTPRENGYTDMRLSGLEFRVKIESAKDEPWSIGGIHLDVVQRGVR